MTLTKRTTAALAWIDAQLAICKAATNGPWTFTHEMGPASMGDSIVECYRRERNTHERVAICMPTNGDADSAFIAAARTGYPEMLETTKNSLLAFMEIEERGFCHCEKAIDSILTRIENLQ